MIKLKSLLMEADPGDPSQATVDISSIMSELKSACNTFNTEIANKTKLNLGNNGLTTSVTPEGQTTGGPYITITSPYFQNISGTKRPYGMIGVELSKGYYGVHNWGVAAINEASLQKLLISIKNLTGQTVIAGDRGSDKGSKFNDKYHDQISAATTTLFNTVDPIFRKLLGYKGYNSATISPTGEVTISKTA